MKYFILLVITVFLTSCISIGGDRSYLINESRDEIYKFEISLPISGSITLPGDPDAWIYVGMQSDWHTFNNVTTSEAVQYANSEKSSFGFYSDDLSNNASFINKYYEWESEYFQDSSIVDRIDVIEKEINEEDRDYILDVHAYVLMTNHVHLLITPHKEDGISKAMQMLGRYYVQYFNYSYERTGTLWEGRYKASLIDSDNYALICYRYIELNPVRADMVDHPSEYPWSSYRHNALGEKNERVMHHHLYQTLGRTDEQRQKAYRALFRARVPHRTLEEIRSATNKAWVLGSEQFKDKLESKLNRPTQPRQRGGDRKSEAYHEKL